MTPISERIAAAPISWGVSEVPGWGYQMEPMRVFEEMRLHGIRASELGPNGYFARDMRVAQAMRSSDLSIMAGFVPITFSFPGGMTDSTETLIETFSRLKNAGAEFAVLAIAGPTTEYQSRLSLRGDDWKRVAEGLKTVEEIAIANGLRTVLHPHFGTYVETTADSLRAIEHSEIGICLDTGHLALAGDNPLELVSLAADSVHHVHLKDVDASLADQVRRRTTPYHDAIQRGLFRPLGQGDVDIEGVVTGLESAGYRGWYVLEQDVALSQKPPVGKGPILDVIKSLEFLSKVEKRIRDATTPDEKADLDVGREAEWKRSA